MSSHQSALGDQRTDQQQYAHDLLRRDYIRECLEHVHHTADMAAAAIVAGSDHLFEVQVELMRLTMREVLKTFSEIKGGKSCPY